MDLQNQSGPDERPTDSLRCESDISRRNVLLAAAQTVALSALQTGCLWANGRPSDLDKWARQVVELNGLTERGAVSVTEWQKRITALNVSVLVSDLVHYLDVERVARQFKYASNLADFGDPRLPASVMGLTRPRQWFMRVFGLRRGGAIIPHIHNNMVSAHLVLDGQFHVRTYDRIRDLDDAVLLRPSINKILAKGEIITMSDVRDNLHWLIAQQDRSMTFDVGVVGLPPSWTYRLHPTVNDNQIFVNPEVPPNTDSTIVAPVMTYRQCAAKFASV